MKKVCIYALDDGSFSVEMEQEGAEGMESPDEMPASPTDMQEDAAEGEYEQVFASVDEALDAARTILAGDTTTDKPMIEGEADFVAGFKQARGGEGMGF